MLQRFSCWLQLILLLLIVPNLITVIASPNLQPGSVKKVYFNPGTEDVHTIRFVTGHAKTKVLFDFVDEVGNSSANLTDVEHAGYYSLKVINSNGSFVDDIWIYHAIPSWLCKFSPAEYLLSTIPTEFIYNRTAVMPCTILGAPQPTFTWEKYDESRNEWINIDTLDLTRRTRYYMSELGHLYIKYFNPADTGRYHCRATNGCGGRCPDQPRCSQEDVIGDEFDLTISYVESKKVSQYFLNPIINQCWDSNGHHSHNSHNCTGLSANAGHIWSFSQYTSVNSTAILEALFDFQRPQNDGMDQGRIGSVKWNEVHELPNFQPLQDTSGKSGMCIARIQGFKKYNMEEYYYCSAYFPNGLLKLGVRFEFVMKEAPYVGFPKGASGKDMSRVIEAHYGTKQNLKFSVVITSEGFDKNKVKDKWMCKFNGIKVHNNWHQSCQYDPDDNRVEFNIDHTVFGDRGYYQILAGNDEGWAIGPPILLVVYGTEPAEGIYVLTLLDCTTDTIRVSWNVPPGEDHAAYNDYTVYIENRDWKEPVTTLSVRSITNAEIRHLKSGVLYGITVRLDGGLVADTKLIRTVSTIPTALIPVKCKEGPTSLRCSWAKLDPFTIPGKSRYVDFHISTNSPSSPVKMNSTKVENEDNITLTNLIPHTEYLVEVFACNDLACNNEPNITAWTTDQEIPGPIVWEEEPLVRYNSVVVSLTFPPISPGNLETEVVRYEEKDYKEFKDKNMDENTESPGKRNLFKQPNFVVSPLKPSTTYYMKFRLKTDAGNGPFSAYYRFRIGRLIGWSNIYIGCGVTLFLCLMATGFCVYVKRKYPGLVKVVVAKIRDHIHPSYMQPTDPFDDFQNQEEDINIVYEFDGPGEVFYLS